MRKVLLIALLGLITKVSTSQTQAYVYDQVHMRNGDVLVGEIIMFQESDGDITFRDLTGRTYSITRKEYDFFRENVVIIDENNKDTTIINERKIYGGAFSVGVAQNLYVTYWNAFIPTALHLSYGKRLSRKTLLGLNLEYSMFENSDVKTYFNPSLFVKHEYDAYRTNVGYYVIGELGYTFMNSNDDLIYKNTFNNIKARSTPIKKNYATIRVGQGFSFYFKNSNSISLELTVSRNELFSQSVEEIDLSDLNNGPYTSTYDESEMFSDFGVSFRVLVNL